MPLAGATASATSSQVKQRDFEAVLND